MATCAQQVKRNARALIAIGLLAAIAGCKDTAGRLPLTGKVTWHGRPLEKGSILFIPTAGHRGPKVGAEVLTGRYEIPAESGATPGAYRVEVRSDTGEYPHSPTDRQTRPPAARPAVAIPPEFNKKSRLSVLVAAERTEFNFELPDNVP